MIIDLLLNPGAPYYLAALALAALAAAALTRLAPQVAGLVPALPAERGRRLLVGQLAGLLVAGLLVAPALIGGAHGSALQLWLAAALAAWLYLGLVVPRRPEVARDKRRAAIRRLLPGFVGYVRVALTGFDAPVVVLSRYRARADRRSAPLREVVDAALEVMERSRARPFAALAQQARLTGCQELVDIADLLAQAEREGGSAEGGLAQHELTLAAILDDEFRRMLKRRTMYLLLLVALSVVVGILGNLLWVMLGPAMLAGGPL